MNNPEILSEKPVVKKIQATETSDQEGTYEQLQEDPGAGNKTLFVNSSKNSKQIPTKKKKKKLNSEHVIFAN